MTGLLKIIVFLVIGWGFRYAGILKREDIEGLKKIILNIAIPAVLFLSFSRLDFSPGFIPVILVVLMINLILFWLGVLLYKLTGSRHRILPLLLSTMNFALIGIPLYEAVFGVENLHHYTMLGIGNEIYGWFIFFFMFRWFLTKGKSRGGINKGFIKSPIVWGIILGCLFSILGLNPGASENALVLGICETLSAAAGVTTPLILIFIGFNISIKLSHLKQGLGLVALRLALAGTVGYGLKLTVLDRFIDASTYYEAAFLLLISLPAVFALPILTAEYLEEDETAVLNNTIVLHSVVTIMIFSIYSLSLQ